MQDQTYGNCNTSPSHHLRQFSLSSTAFLASSLLQISRSGCHIISPCLSCPLSLSSSIICPCVIPHLNYHLHHHSLSPQQHEHRIITRSSPLLFLAWPHARMLCLTQQHHTFQTFMIHSIPSPHPHLCMSAPKQICTDPKLKMS